MYITISKTPALNTIRFVPDQQSRKGYTTVKVDVAKLDRAWRKDKDYYIGKGGVGGIRNRYQTFISFLDEGVPIEQSVIGIDVYNNDMPSFTNGRHRFAVLRDLGMKHIPISVPNEEVTVMRELFT